MKKLLLLLLVATTQVCSVGKSDIAFTSGATPVETAPASVSQSAPVKPYGHTIQPDAESIAPEAKKSHKKNWLERFLGSELPDTGPFSGL